MAEGFQDYLRRMRPQLNGALRRQLVYALEEMTPRERSPLDVALFGGKRIRGGLLCLVGQALGGDLESAIPRAVAIEFIQAATLIHDDYVDQHTTRRGQPAVWTLEGARRAVLMGDVIFATAIKMMSDLGRVDGVIVSDAIARLSKGAFHEPLDRAALLRDISSKKLDGKLYDQIIHLKTGILFGAACELGAISAKADDGVRARYRSYGLRIGEAYQIADDLKEVNHHLLTLSIHPDQMVALAPALLRFVGEIRPHVLRVLNGDGLQVRDALLEFLRAAAVRMEDEIHNRLRAAVLEVEGLPHFGGCGELVRRTPWDLVNIFNAS